MIPTVLIALLAVGATLSLGLLVTILAMRARERAEHRRIDLEFEHARRLIEQQRTRSERHA